jgi:tetratricopeptide (TPR) repeat protein
MYITRKLILNPALAKSRVALDRIQLSGSVSLIAISLGNILPTGVLLGRSFIDDDMVEGGGKEVEQLRSELYSDEVDTFLNGCENDLKRGVPILPDSISKAALLHYYRTYFEPREVREAQMAKAESWINRALLRDPLDLAFQIKLADIFGLQDRYDEAVSIFERLERNDESPQYVQQWLGYFLLFIEGREREAIRHSLEFHRRFSDEASGLFNAACGYAQLYGIELREKHKSSIATSENRKKCLEILEQAISIDPETKATALKYATADDSFASLSSDKAFHRLTSTTSP